MDWFLLAGSSYVDITWHGRFGEDETLEEWVCIYCLVDCRDALGAAAPACRAEWRADE